MKKRKRGGFTRMEILRAYVANSISAIFAERTVIFIVGILLFTLGIFGLRPFQNPDNIAHLEKLSFSLQIGITILGCVVGSMIPIGLICIVAVFIFRKT